MKARYLVTFEGVAAKAAAALEAMLRRDVEGYPARLAMSRARVEPAPAAKPKRKAGGDAES